VKDGPFSRAFRQRYGFSLGTSAIRLQNTISNSKSKKTKGMWRTISQLVGKVLKTTIVACVETNHKIWERIIKVAPYTFHNRGTGT
jgi:hypothetical protein